MVAMKDFREYFWYSLLVVASILYVYRVAVFGINLSPFRVLYIAWLLIFLKDFLLSRLRFRWAYLIYAALFSGILVLNGFDLLRMSNADLYGRDTINHLVNVSLVGLLILYVDQEEKVDRLIQIYSAFSLLALAIAIYVALTGRVPFEEMLKAYQAEQVTQVNFAIQWQGMPRLASSFYDPNFYGLYLCFVIIFSLYLIYLAKGRSLYRVILLTSVAALLGTMSRSALVGFLVVLVVTLFKIPRSSRFVLALFIGSLFGGLLLLVPGADTLSISGFLDRMVDPESVHDRFRYILNGFDVFERNPVFGAGTEGLISDGIPTSSAHLVYLSLLAKFGLVGFVVYAIFIFYPLFYVFQKGPTLALKYRYLIVVTYCALAVMYFAYDYFAFLEFQYIVFGIIYSIILNNLGINAVLPEEQSSAGEPVKQAGAACAQSWV